jgi:pimeloyl-ACP methyl ester carboxylesterase
MMIDYSSNFSVANGIKLHYYRMGRENPALVLVHGVTDDGLCWTPVAEVFAKEYDVIMVDTRGHGKSDAPEEGYALTDLATDLASLVQSLGLKNPLFLGHSLGAVTVLAMAGMYPNLPRAILLEDPPAFWVASQLAPTNAPTANPLLDWLNANKRKTHEELLNEVHTNNPGWAEAEIEPWINSKHRYSPRIGAILSMPNRIPPDFPDLVKKITCPALLISADPGLGAILTKRDVAQLKEFVPHLQVAHIDGAGHNIRRDQFNPYMDAVKTYLSGLV